MRTFFVSSFLLFLLFLGIFIGIQYAEHGIYAVEGKDVPPQSMAVAVNADGDVVELSLLGKTFTKEEFAAIRGQTDVQVEIKEEENMYAELGQIIGLWVEKGMRGLTEMILGWLDGFI